MRTNHLPALLVLCLLSCTKNTACQLEPAFHLNSHVIPIDQAINDLNQFLESEKNTKTKLSADYSVTVLPSSHIGTKSTESYCDSLLYIINFSNNNGYAVLAADDRISSNIIAVTEKGALSIKDFKKFQDDVIIPSDTLKLYDEELDDYLVGDYTGDGQEDSVKIINNSPIIADMILDYAEGELSKNKEREFVDTFNDGSGNVKMTVEHSTTQYYEEKVTPLLADFNDWTQDGFFSYLCPTVFKRKTACGCVNLALAYIMTFWKFPDTYELNGCRIDWNDLHNPHSSITDTLTAAFLLRHMGKINLSIYLPRGTFTFPSLAAKYLSNSLYENVEYIDYDTQKVVKALNNGCPIMICSIPTEGITGSHAWVIDGYKDLHEYTTIKHYKNGIYQYSNYTSHTINLIHCNFGWGSYGNGYFTSGVFDLKKVRLDDSKKESPFSDNYTKYLKIITYDAPR
jgi:hypothetical protein